MHIQAFTKLSRSRSVVWCVLCVHVACVVCGLCVYMWCCVWCVGCVCICGVVCGVGGVCVVLLWWCVCVVCGEAWHTLSLSLLFSLLPLLFPFLFSLLSFFFSLLSLFLLSSLLATKHYGKNRSINMAVNMEAFECDLAQGKCTAVGYLPPLLPSLLPSPPLPTRKKKKERGLFITRIFPARNLFFITVLN